MKKKKIIYLILALSFIISAPGLLSCETDGYNESIERTAFTPASKAYEIMLNPEEWIDTEFSRHPNQLQILNSGGAGLLTVDRYTKNSLSDMGISGFDNFIEFYKTQETAKNIYENPLITKTGDFKDVEKKHMKNSDVTAGKRQTLQLKSGDGLDITVEVIYLETEKNFLAMSYNSISKDFSKAQKIVNDAVAHLVMIK